MSAQLDSKCRKSIEFQESAQPRIIFDSRSRRFMNLWKQNVAKITRQHEREGSGAYVKMCDK